MMSDRQSDSVRRRARGAWPYRATAGEPLTLLLIALSILLGIALAIACSYRPVALWWLMIGGSAVSLVRLAAELARKSRADRMALPAPAAALVRVLIRIADAFARAGSSASKASLDRQHTRFLVWFTEHNLLWTMAGFGVSLLLWHRFGPTTPTLVVMAALMSCALFAALGATIGSRAPTLGLCWQEPCRTPDLRSPGRLVHDIGCVIVLANRRDDAARRDWANGGRFHELFLTVDDLARAGIEPGLQAVLAGDDPAALRTLARKERVDRALALTPVFAAAVLAALLVVPPLAGSEPLPSLWAIVTGNTKTQPRAMASGDDDAPGLAPGATPSSNTRVAQDRSADRSRQPSSSSGNRDATSSTSRAGAERPDLTGQNAENGMSGDAAVSAQGDGTAAAGEGAGAAEGDGSGAGSGAPGSGTSSSGGGQSGGSGGGRGSGGDPRAFGTSGVAPQRAESPNAIPDAPVNPGKAIEIVLPAFSEARDASPGDDPLGTKRKAKPTEEARASKTRTQITNAPKDSATREPVQRWPNWIFQLLHKR